MDTLGLSRLLTRDLGSEYVVVAHPDHPELLSAPTLLVGGKGRLTAIFRVSRYTRTRSLQSHVIGARLALPASTRFVAVTEPQGTLSERFSYDTFDNTVDGTDGRGLVQLCSELKHDEERERELRQNQERHAITYWTFFQIAELRRRRSLQPGDAIKVLASLASRWIVPTLSGSEQSAAGSRRARFKVNFKDTTIAALPQIDHKPHLGYLEPFCSDALSEDFVLQRGIPYQRRTLPRILMVESWPSRRGDPNKPIRSAAFSGWVMALATSPKDIEDLMERSHEVVNRRLNESA